MTTTIRPIPPTRAGAGSGIPPLQNGDRLSRVEFERRYAAMPDSQKAELIEGIVYLMSPPISNDHSGPHFDLILWLGLYRLATEGVAGGDNGTLRLDLDNDPQPDAFLRIESESGGQSRVSDDKYIEGAPELIAEVAASSVSYDLHAKLNAYRRNGVPEYVVWRVLDGAIDWFILRDGAYERLEPGNDGILRSRVFPGLVLDAPALVKGDLPRVNAVLQESLKSPEHAAFVTKLKQKRNSAAG